MHELKAQYDQIDHDVRPFWGISPETFRKKAKVIEEDPLAL